MSGEMEKIRKKLDEFEEKMTHTRVTLIEGLAFPFL
jgi:hypothetical protein